jgi:hypothetical protein
MLTEREEGILLGELAATAELLGQAITPAAAALMTKDLSVYPLAVLRRALARVRSEHTGKLTPKAILERGEILAGRLSPKEAWAVALSAQDEAATVVWNNEIQEAWGQARQMAEARDKVGARMAFIAAYERITATAREQRRLPEAVVSIGWDGEQRAIALDRAVAAGLLGTDQAAQYSHALALPAPVFNPLALLEGKVAVHSEAPPELRQRLVELRDEFARRKGRYTAAQVRARAERMRLGAQKRKTAAAVESYLATPHSQENA